ncbi:hypothetical protein Tco_0518682, partial [Tanacetum coccineum]
DRIHKLCAPIKAGVGRNLEEQIHLGDRDIYGDRRARSLMNKRMPGEYAARRRDSNFEMVSSIDVRSYNHGSSPK